MARKKKRVARKRGFQVPVAVVAGFIPGFTKVWEHSKQGWSAASREAGRVYLGLDWWEGRFNWQWMLYGTMPIVLGVFAHKLVGGRLGLNRALASAGIPFIRF